MSQPDKQNSNSSFQPADEEARFAGLDRNIPIRRVETEIMAEPFDQARSENETSPAQELESPQNTARRNVQNLQNFRGFNDRANLQTVLLEEENTQNQIANESQTPKPSETKDQPDILTQDADAQQIDNEEALRVQINLNNPNVNPNNANAPLPNQQMQQEQLRRARAIMQMIAERNKNPSQLQMSYIFKTDAEPEIIEIGEFGVVDSLFQISLFSTTHELVLAVFLGVSAFYKAYLWTFFAAIALVQLVSFFQTIYHLIKNRKLDTALLLNFYILILDKSTWLLYTISLALYFSKCASIWLVLGMNLLLLVNSIGLYVLSRNPRVYEGEGVYQIFVIIGYLMIFLKLGGYIDLSWNSTIILFRLELLMFKIVGGILAFALPITFGLKSIMPPNTFEAAYLKLFGNLSVVFLVYIVCINWLYYFYRQLLVSGSISPNKFIYEPISGPSSNSTWLLAILVFVLYLLEVFFFTRTKNMFKFLIAQECLISQPNKTIEVTKFSQPLDLQLIRMGSNYFKRKMHQSRTFNPDNSESQAPTHQMAECLICCENDSNVLIRPCNHGGLCERCAQTMLLENSSCPHCKTPISKFYIFKFEPQTGKYFAHRMLKLQPQHNQNR